MTQEELKAKRVADVDTKFAALSVAGCWAGLTQTWIEELILVARQRIGGRLALRMVKMQLETHGHEIACIEEMGKAIHPSGQKNN